jgi:Aerobic-type carbon monoxide dehydrogenase, large subunit CoxL/CutL homologs
MSDHANFARRKKESKKNGKLRGIAVGSYLEVPHRRAANSARSIRAGWFGELTTGTLDYGQGHATPFAQVLSAQLGVPFEKITLTRTTATSCASATAPAARARSPRPGTAIVESSGLVVAKGKQAAAFLMEASEGDIEFANGRFTIAGTDRSIGIMELAQRLRQDKAQGKVPEGVPRRSTSTTPPRRRPRPSPMAATSRKSRSIPRPA